ncbi:MAG: hypothetical protein ACT4OO_12795, partial [Nitrospiraceae bacterium]
FVCCGLVVTESTDRTDLTIEPYDFAEYEGLTSDHPLGNSDMRPVQFLGHPRSGFPRVSTVSDKLCYSKQQRSSE